MNLKKILIADDDDDTRILYRNVLETRNYHISEVDNGDQLMESLKENMPDLLLLDLKMPGKSGLEVVEELYQNNEPLPILVLTGYSALKDDFSLWKSANVIDVFVKPCDLHELLERVSDILGQ